MEQKELVAVNVTTSPALARQGADTSVNALFKIVTGELPPRDDQPQRAPLNLCIVLDRSGSMSSGGSLRLNRKRGARNSSLRSAIKKSMFKKSVNAVDNDTTEEVSKKVVKDKMTNAIESIVQIIQNLEARDILHLVVYDDNVDVVFENALMSGDRDALVRQVRSIRTSGSTNLYGGLERGADLVTRYHQIGFSKRVFLFSDGQVNSGLCDKPTIYKNVQQIHQEHGIAISAFGLGDDFDEDLMKEISEKASGTYFFIESSETIPQFVEFALGGIMSTIGMNAVLKIKNRGGGVIKQIFGYDLEEGATLGDLKQKNMRSAVCELTVAMAADDDELEVLEWELTYEDPQQENATQTLTGVVSMHAAADFASLEESKDNVVEMNFIVQQTMLLDKEIMTNIDSGNKAEAIRNTERQVELLESVVEFDVDGSTGVAGMLAAAKKDLQELKKEGINKKSRKKAQHRAYQKRRASLTYNNIYS